MSLRVRCNRCRSVAFIRDSTEVQEDFKKLYCICKNPQCGHSFVMDLTFSNTLSPSALDLAKPLSKKLASLNRQQQRELFSALS